jgi:hypothetical protein
MNVIHPLHNPRALGYWTAYRKGVALSVLSVLLGTLAMTAGFALVSHLSDKLSSVVEKMKGFAYVQVAAPIAAIGLIASATAGVMAYRKMHPKLTYAAFCDLAAGYKNFVPVASRGWKSMRLANSVISVDKLHISVARNPADNMAKAFDVVFPLILSYGIESFKILDRTAPDVYVNDPNITGKEFVLYIPESMTPAQIEGLTRTIGNALTDAAIRQGPQSLGDIPLQNGQGYVHTRSQNNVFGGYIPADFLVASGFTALESAYLSPSKCLPARAPNPLLDRPLPPISHAPARALKEKLIRSFVQNLSAPVAVWRNVSSLFCLSVGAEDRRERTAVQNAILAPFYPSIDDFERAAIGDFANLAPDLTPFITILEKAALLACDAHAALGTTESAFGNILPAIYAHYLVPLKKAHDEARALVLSAHEERALIREIVKCTFRVQGGQSGRMQPLYLPTVAAAHIDMTLA